MDEALELTITEADRRGELADLAAELAELRVVQRALIRALRVERAKVQDLEARLEAADMPNAEPATSPAEPSG